MLRENNQILQRIHQGWDLGLTVAAFISAYGIKQYLLPEPWRGLSREPNYYTLLLLCIIIWYVVFRFSGIYRPYRRRPFSSIFLNVLRSVAVCVMLMVVMLFLIKEQTVSRIFLGLFVGLDVTLLVGSKWLLYTLLQNLRKRGYNFRNVLIVGCGQRAEEISRSIEQQRGAGFRVMGCLSAGGGVDDEGIRNGGNFMLDYPVPPSPRLWRTRKPGNDEQKRPGGDGGGGPEDGEIGPGDAGGVCVPVIGDIADIERLLTEHVVDELVFAEPLRNIPNAGEYIHTAEQMGVLVHIMPEWGLRRLGLTPRMGTLQIEALFGLPTLVLNTTPDHNPFIELKNISDFIASGLGLLACALPFGIIAIAIRLSSSGPVFYKQERVGQNGRRFTLYKFRTMIDGADQIQTDLLDKNESDGPVFKMRNDPRVTPWVGAFLRKTSLDELPQLINVFVGHMSLVGPRPPLPEEIVKYGKDQRRRLSMKPGITCLWQITPRRNDLSFKEWIKLDLEYIDNWSLWLDFKILAKTVWVVVTGQGR